MINKADMYLSDLINRDTLHIHIHMINITCQIIFIALARLCVFDISENMLKTTKLQNLF